MFLVCIGFVISKSSDAQNIKIYNMDKSYSTQMVEVTISGEVKNPGTYRVNKGMNLYDALYMAGGIKRSADISSLNLDLPIISSCAVQIDALPKDTLVSVTKHSYSPDLKCNINTATAYELSYLPEIGSVVSESIVKYREQNGNYKTIDDIKNVKGIGNKTYQKIKDYITVGGE